jgi:hypothetical protein
MAKSSQQAKKPINQVIAAMKKNIIKSMPYSSQEERTWFCDKQSAKALIEYLVPDTKSFDELMQAVQNAKAMQVVGLLNNQVTLKIDLDTSNLIVDGVPLKINKGEWAVVGTEPDANLPSNVISISQAPSAKPSSAEQNAWVDYQTVKNHFNSKYQLNLKKLAPILSAQQNTQGRISTIWNNDDLSLYEKEFSILNILELQSYHDRLKKDPEDSPQRVARKSIVPEETALERLTRAIRHDAICFGIVYVALAFPVILTYGLTLTLTQQLFFFGIIIPVFSIWVGGKIGWKTPRLFSK